MKQLIKTFFSQDHIESVVRGALKGLGGAAIAHGVATNTTWTAVTGYVMTGIGFLYSFLDSHDSQKSASTVAPSPPPIAPTNPVMKVN